MKHDTSFKQNNGAGGRTRTPDLLITNQLLYQLSYTSALLLNYYITLLFICQDLFQNFFKFFLKLFEKVLVEATGLEPAASCSQSKHSTKLSYASVRPLLVRVRQLLYYSKACMKSQYLFSCFVYLRKILHIMLNAIHLCNKAATKRGALKLPA